MWPAQEKRKKTFFALRCAQLAVFLHEFGYTLTIKTSFMVFGLHKLCIILE
jgi:hypothetical protein